ncbi:UDP-N-acetylmuramate dehydrogenase [Thermanaeromonas toyohensis ToBE]|uniref:UDP-N-acetylenolpyruvoylglucosamine reductase n=1 Tax=Thermanaeromonas toyohensis ToBE TaxID=698762 RepID=A0A1W1VM10_9FIRM|nr:UDP-N-acetylmuramate dehydrogenase [Thermanaeromonas toyohensis]SMB94356.1 UDP-N-acetylmuramate dehydrogenase [Thermanaeromonas toyohensis ToBE]
MNDLSSLGAELQRYIMGQVLIDEPLSRHTTFRIGGPADLLVLPISRADLEACLEFSRQKGVPLHIMGKGSNLLVRERGVRGLVIKTTKLSRIRVEDLSIRAEAGASLARVLSVAQKAGLSGLEFATGIPATLGGATVMNAGTPDGFLGEVILKVEVLDKEGRFLFLESSELGFGYRESRLKGSGLVIVTVELALKPGDPKEIARLIAERLALRRRKQPLAWPNAGCIFKNPPGYAAGWLIEQAGAKGWRQGDAEVSTTHANFIINRGKATASDVLALVERIREAVFRRFGIYLELEIETWGEGP